ncbi:MAG: nicotinate-nucleotide adenylyltransferase [Thermoguttaceae bacterium]
MRLGLFGGSFDPVHYGHLLLAECCRQQCALAEVHFLPAALPPHKQHRQLTRPEHRIEMLKLATAGHEAFSISRHEVDRGGVSYTAETLEHYRTEYPGAELFLLMGGDMLEDLPHWRDAWRICQLAIPAVAARPGIDDPDFSCLAQIAPPERIELFRKHRVAMPLIGIASSEIRRRVAAGLSIRYWTPRSVEQYIQTHGLYRHENQSG